MRFPDALEMLRGGGRMYRAEWNAAWQYVELAENAVARLAGGTAVRMRPFLALHTAQDEWVPWTVSQTDALEDDWAVAAD